jgi:outer membrane protein W
MKVEITPFGGFETGSSAPVSVPTDLNGNPQSGIDRIGIDKGGAYGVFLDYNKSENFSYELMWARSNSSLSQHDFTTGQSFDSYSATADQYQFGVLYHLADSKHKLRPFVAGGLGFTRTGIGTSASVAALANPFFTPTSASSSDTAFSFNVGGGAKYYINRHFGLRADVRFLPTYASSTEGYSYNAFGATYGTQRNFYKRLMTGGGLIFRF